VPRAGDGPGRAADGRNPALNPASNFFERSLSNSYERE
jgi:hypothetical protein